LETTQGSAKQLTIGTPGGHLTTIFIKIIN